MIVKVKWKDVTVLFVALLVFSPLGGAHEHCRHNYPKDKDVIRGVGLDPVHVVRRRSIDQPLRIAVHYDRSVLELDKKKRDVINGTIIPEAVHFWERALMVRKTGNVIRLNRRCVGDRVFYRRRATYCMEACEAVTSCGEVRVPEEHLDVCRTCDDSGHNCIDSGPDGIANIPAGEDGAKMGAKGLGVSSADFILYVSAVETERCNWGSTVAYAAHCQQEAALDRPIAGFANLCPSSLDADYEKVVEGKKVRTKSIRKSIGDSITQDHRLQVSTVKHEILHALGFSVSLFAFYRDDHGMPLTPRSKHGWPPLDEHTQVRKWSDRVVRKVVRNNWLAGGEEAVWPEIEDDEGEEEWEEDNKAEASEGVSGEAGEQQHTRGRGGAEDVDTMTESLGRDERRKRRRRRDGRGEAAGEEEESHGLEAGGGDPLVRKERKVTGALWGGVLKRVRREVHMLVTDRVVAEARAHFGCPLLEGAELEDQGGDGTELTHWEKRVFEDEAMTGTQTQEGSFSRLTLALMEDTGWYRANYSVAAPLHWGKGLGCSFAMRSCADWMMDRKSKGLSEAPFCTRVKRNPLHTECTHNRKSVALCNLLQFPEPLPPLYQNFEKIDGVDSGMEPLFGGSVELADRCPYLQEFVWRSGEQASRTSFCLLNDNNPSSPYNFALESYGEGSLCVEQGGPWEERSCKVVRQWGHWGAGCYQVFCSAGRLHIQVENRTFTCFYAGQVVVIQIWANEWLHKGNIICPPCKDVCQEKFEAVGDRCKDDIQPSDVQYRNQISAQQQRLLDDPVCGARAIHSQMSLLMIMVAALLVIPLIQR
ncbi:leishmanolysin-like peptidase [Hetaerina americana]|uniref:leishmanolysin-like peptidase n=1 Tax=Hetaerina americana TaxID=62018 RepID=UPI003A7F21C8